MSHLLPPLYELCRIRKLAGLIDAKERFAGNSDVPRVFEGSTEIREVLEVVLRTGIRLFDKHAVGRPVPDARPGLVRPRDTKRKIRTARSKDLVEWALEQSLSCEPVVPIAESGNSVALREIGLGFPRLANPQIIEAELSRQMWLHVPAEKWPGLCHVRPLGEALSPPLVVLRDRMELWEIVRNDFHVDAHDTCRQ